MNQLVDRFQGLEGVGDDHICDYLVRISSDDDMYEDFMGILRQYKTYTGFSKRKHMVSGFIFYLTAFCNSDGNDPAQRRSLAHIFRATFDELERMRTSSMQRRDFAADFGCSLSVAGWAAATALLQDLPADSRDGVHDPQG